MTHNFNTTFDENNEIHNYIDELLSFLNKIFNDYNNKIIKRKRLLDFYDLFFYLLYFNSSINETHRSSNYNFNVKNNKTVSENAFINRLVKLDFNHIKDINDQFINFYYTLFKIDINKITTASDGSEIKLLSSLNQHFKLNKNSHYTNATISCIYDVDNNFPLFMNIQKSFNEVNNLLKQMNDNVISKYKYKITNITDRGYDSNKLIEFYLANDISFVSRITKNNKYVNHINNNDNNNGNNFDVNFNNKNYKLKIIKYTNLNKPDIKESKTELIDKIKNIDIKINNEKNELITINKIYDDLSIENKIELKKMKLPNLNKYNLNIIKKKINKNRILKSINQNKIKNIKNKIDELNLEKNKLKSKYEKIETYEHSDFYIITNNLKYTLNELKSIYKKRWCVETSFKFDKTKLNLNQMNNKNIHLINQNVYIIQFIYIMNAFINKILEKKINKDYYLNKSQIFESLHNDIFNLLKDLLINKKNKLKKNKSIKNKKNNELMDKLMDKLIVILILISKCKIKVNKNIKNNIRIKKRINNNKFNYRNKEQNIENIT